jgi:hypothetical protein
MLLIAGVQVSLSSAGAPCPWLPGQTVWTLPPSRPTWSAPAWCWRPGLTSAGGMEGGSPRRTALRRRRAGRTASRESSESSALAPHPPVLLTSPTHLSVWLTSLPPCRGLHFLAVQPDPDSEELNGLWLLQDRPTPQI